MDRLANERCGGRLHNMMRIEEMSKLIDILNDAGKALGKFVRLQAWIHHAHIPMGQCTTDCTHTTFLLNTYRFAESQNICSFDLVASGMMNICGTTFKDGLFIIRG